MSLEKSCQNPTRRCIGSDAAAGGFDYFLGVSAASAAIAAGHWRGFASSSSLPAASIRRPWFAWRASA